MAWRGQCGVFLVGAALAIGCSRRAAEPAPAPASPPLVQPAGGSAESTRAPAATTMGAPAATATGAAEPRSGSSSPFDEHNGMNNASTGTDCQTDHDCVCGIERATGACAVGPASRVDTERQCPDFCGGIDGRMRTVCDHGRCAQTR